MIWNDREGEKRECDTEVAHPCATGKISNLQKALFGASAVYASY